LGETGGVAGVKNDSLLHAKVETANITKSVKNFFITTTPDR
jgi:hypothetical protein